MQAALEKAGVIFTAENGDGPRVRAGEEEDEAMSEERTKSIAWISGQLGVSREVIADICNALFEGATDLSDAGDGLGLSVSAAFSENDILALPASIQETVRTNEDERSGKRRQILECIRRQASDLDDVELAQLTDAAISAWEWEVELDHPNPRQDTELRCLLKAHYELGELIHACVDAEQSDPRS